MKVVHPAPDVLNMTEDPVQFWIDPFVPHEGYVLLYGKFGTYKTPLTLAMANAIAQGKELWGLAVRQAKVLYIEMDSPPKGILPRMKKALEPSNNLDVAFAYPGFNLLNPSIADVPVINQLKEAHKTRGYNVVFIDALRGVHNLDDKESNTPHIVYRALSTTFPDSAIVMVHHDRKLKPDDNPEAMDESFSGSQAWANHATVAIRIHHTNKAKHEIHLTQTKSQVSEMHSALHLRVDDGVHILLKNKVMLQDVKQALDELKGMPLMEADKLIAMKLGVSKRTVQKLRHELKVLEGGEGEDK